MILSELREYLRTNGRATLSDMAIRFDKDPDALRGMLQKWIAKGRVKKLSGDGTCSRGCAGCTPPAVEIYEWKD